MSGYRNFQKRGQESEAPERDESRCSANGCPCRSSVSLGGGKWLCSFHAFGPADRWATITGELRNHLWLMDFMSDLRADSLTLDRDWREYATKFWQGSDDAQIPAPQEFRESYLYRMHQELMHRVGARSKGGAVHLPAAAPVRRFGNLAESLGEPA